MAKIKSLALSAKKKVKTAKLPTIAAFKPVSSKVGLAAHKAGRGK
jgi:hypothetical protein